MFRISSEIKADIKAQVAVLEAACDSARLIKVAQILQNARLDMQFYGELWGLDVTPNIRTAIDHLTDAEIAAGQWIDELHFDYHSDEAKLCRLMKEDRQALEHWRRESLRPRSSEDMLEEVLGLLESSQSWTERDVAVSLLCAFPHLAVERLLTNKPTLLSHVAGHPSRSREQALLACSAERSGDGLVARVADLLIRMHDR